VKKVMLIFEDFQSSGQTQTDLKKVGFDVMAINTTARLSDQILTFRPDIIVSNGGHKIPSMLIGQEIKKVTHYRGKSVLILPKGERPGAAELAKARVDVLIEAPVQPKRLIEILAKSMELDATPLLEKFTKAKIQEHAPPPVPRSTTDAPNVSEMITVKGGAKTNGPVKIEDKDRVQGYQAFIKGMNIDIQQTSHNKQAIRARQEELKKGWDFKLLEQLDKLKQKFAEALFKKNN